MRNRRGISLLTVLVLLAVLVALFLLMASQSMAYLLVSDKIWDSEDADSLAESLVSATIVSLVGDETFEDRVEIAAGELGPGSGFVQFDPDSGEPWSVNNFHGTAAVPGYQGTSVPAQMAQIVAVVQYEGASKVVEVMVKKPGFPHAAATNGRFIARGRNEAAALDSLARLESMTDAGTVDMPASELMRTSIATSHRGLNGEAPMLLQGELTVYGDALSAGDIEMSDQVSFLHGGRAKVNQRGVELPSIDLTRYDPDNQPADVQVVHLGQSSYPSGTVFDGFNRWRGDSGTTLTLESVELDGGLLFVEGDVELDSITGSGALVCTGSVTIRRHANLTADSQVAVLAGGDLSLSGIGRDHSMFVGMLYCEGDLTVANTTVVGATVANKDSAEGAQMLLSEARLVNSEEAARFEVREAAGPGGSGGGSPLQLNVGTGGGSLERYGLRILEPSVEDFQQPDGTFAWDPTLIRISYEGQAYSDPNDPRLISQLSSHAQNTLGNAHNSMMNTWQTYIESLDASNIETDLVFHLDLNELLTLVEELNVASWRPLTP